MRLIDEIDNLDLKQKDKEKIFDLLDNFNFVEAPKRINISTIYKLLNKRYSSENITIDLKRNYKEYKDENGDVYKDMYFGMFVGDIELSYRSVMILESVNSQMYKIRYVEPCEMNKDLFAMWLCGTNIIDDLRKSI